ncbi:MAG: phosphatase PAP2 family protein [Solirubrobacteraceae bacterium]|nr:MAG: hypothetical protein DLM63_11440 [Solirubrobacterales bacterium]
MPLTTQSFLVLFARARRLLLPQGVLDALRQATLCLIVYEGYSLVRGAVWNQDITAFTNARWVIGFERGTHLFFEPAVQSWTASKHWLIVILDWLYLNSQFSIAMAVLAFIYLRHNRSFYFVRNMFLVAMILALVGYIIFPTAPPRMFSEWGFRDSVAQLTGIPPENPTVNAIFNPYAAVPSMHIAFALMLAWSLARLSQSRIVRAVCWSWPLLILWTVIATGNHFWFDALWGAVVAGAAVWGARRMAQLRPQAWAFPQPQPAEATA